jgi:hypothetical protein
MGSLAYFSPDIDVVDDPTSEFLREIILHSKQDYWQVGGGAGALRVMRGTRKKRTWNTKAASLEFYLVEPHGFCFNYFGADSEELTPLVGSAGRPWVVRQHRGQPDYMPLGCFVGRDVALVIVEEFCRTRQPSPVVPWSDWWELDIPFASYEVTPEDIV